MSDALETPVQVKGSLILGRVGYVQDTFGPRWPEFLSAVQPATSKAIKDGVLKSNWYPFDMFVDCSGTAEKLFGAGDYSLVRKMAAHSARVNMPTIYKIFLRLGSPEYMISKVAQIWRSQYDSGVATYSVWKNGGAVEVREFGQPRALHCEGVCGFMEECLHITGMQVAKVEHTKCRARGDDVCRWVATWS